MGESPMPFFIMPNPIYPNSIENMRQLEGLWNLWFDAPKDELNGILDRTLNPGQVQFSEWSQQMMATMYQNWYNSAPNQMELMKQAGINPYLAANGIAGSGNTSVASTPPAGSNGSDVLNAAANLASVGNNIVSDAVKSYDTLKTLSHRNTETDAHSRALLSEAGFNDASVDGILIDNSYKDENWIAELNIKRQNYTNMQAEYNMINTQKDFIQKQLDWYDAQIQSTIDLNTANQLQLEKQKFYLEQMGVAQQLENQFFSKWWSHSDSPAGVALKNLWLKAQVDGDDSIYYRGVDALTAFYTEKSYADAIGVYRADNETAYDRAHNASLGSYTADPFQQQYREIYDEIDKLSNQDQQCKDIITALDNALKNNEISKDEYDTALSRIKDCQRDIRKSSKELNKEFKRLSYSAGHASQLNDITNDLIKIGVLIGGAGVFKTPPKPIKGYGR